MIHKISNLAINYYKKWLKESTKKYIIKTNTNHNSPPGGPLPQVLNQEESVEDVHGSVGEIIIIINK